MKATLEFPVLGFLTKPLTISSSDVHALGMDSATLWLQKRLWIEISGEVVIGRFKSKVSKRTTVEPLSKILDPEMLSLDCILSQLCLLPPEGYRQMLHISFL